MSSESAASPRSPSPRSPSPRSPSPRSPSPRSPSIHEIVLDRDGEPGGRGRQVAAVPERLGGLAEIARRAGEIAGPLELSFFWRDGDGDLVFATARSTGHTARTSLTWAEDPPIPHGLTPRELDVVTLLVGGLSNTEIAARLWTSSRTVSTHVERILTKLGVRTRAGAAALALEESLLLLPIPGGSQGFERLLLGMVSPQPGAQPPATAAAAFAARDAAHPDPYAQPDPYARSDPYAQPDPYARPAPYARDRDRDGDGDGDGNRDRDRARAPRSNRRSVRRPILLGCAFPVTGEIAEDGREMLRASRLAIDEINQGGGIGGRAVELLNVDLDIKSAASIGRAFEELAEQDVDAMVSGYLGDQEVAHEIVADHGAPYLHAATLDSMVRLVEDNPARYGNVFQICPSDTCYGPGFVQALTFLRDSRQIPVRSRSLAIVRGRWKYGDLGIPAAAELAERNGWRLDHVADDVEGQDAWREQGRRIAELAPAAVMIGSYFTDETIPFLRAFLADPSPTVLYALYAPSIPRFRVELGPQAEGLLWATTTGTYSDEVARRFTERYRDAWAVSPGRSHAGIAYDRVRILARAWATAGSSRDFASVAGAVRESVHRGVNGAYSFAGAGQSALSYPLATSDPSIAMAHLVFQLQDNRQRIVHPSPYTEARFRQPPWWP